MAVATVLPGAGAGTLVSGDSRKLGRVVPKFSPRPRKLMSWLRLHEHQLQNQKCFLQIPRTSFFNLKSSVSTSHSAFAKEAEDGFLPDVSEDTDEMYDELFEKYGKMVYRSNEKKPPTAEVDDDAESLSFAVEMAKIASDVKAADLKLLFVKPLVYWTKFFIIATAFSNPQIDAIGSKMRDLAEKKYGRSSTGDAKPNSWTLLDFGDLVVHVFLPEQRTLYNLDEFYANAPAIELPFENQNQPPFRR